MSKLHFAEDAEKLATLYSGTPWIRIFFTRTLCRKDGLSATIDPNGVTCSHCSQLLDRKALDKIRAEMRAEVAQ